MGVILILEHIKLFNFNYKLKVLYEYIPTYDKYKKVECSNYSHTDYITLEGNINLIRRVLPIKSLTFKHVGYLYHEVTFDKKEFNIVIKNNANYELLKFIEEYLKLSYNNKLYYYNTFRETLELLLELIKEKVHYHNSNEVVELIKGLIVNLPENTHDRESKKIEHNVLKEKLKFELEFLNRLNNKEIDK